MDQTGRTRDVGGVRIRGLLLVMIKKSVHDDSHTRLIYIGGGFIGEKTLDVQLLVKLCLALLMRTPLCYF